MSERTGVYAVQGVGVQAWQPGQRVRMREYPVYGTYVRPSVGRPGWHWIEHDDGTFDLGRFLGWEVVPTP